MNGNYVWRLQLAARWAPGKTVNTVLSTDSIYDWIYIHDILIVNTEFGTAKHKLKVQENKFLESLKDPKDTQLMNNFTLHTSHEDFIDETTQHN